MRYDRQWRFSGSAYREYFPVGVKWLLISNVAMFIVSSMASGTEMMSHLRLLSLVPEAVVKHFAIWQLFTYLFLHGGFQHILFNMLGLWMCGSMLERDWGTRRFLKYYFVCGVGAGLCNVVLAGAMGQWTTPTIGASGAIYGLLLAIGVLYPNQNFYMYFLFPIRAKYLVMIYGAMAFLGALQVNSGVSHIAHLGGMLFGFFFLKARFIRMDLGYFRREYEAWKLRRAKRRFQVYMRKHQGRQ